MVKVTGRNSGLTSMAGAAGKSHKVSQILRPGNLLTYGFFFSSSRGVFWK